ncbi:NAD-dependent epimerase/dehydratase family protein [Caulobacter sp. 17J80-11]|uniref:NAD(P)H-binding protein n=1 Tax=Caulobacter sp. 17J80-11 TaxID=2763502 RepID=UPI001653EC63|nr:NAD-dependent epimerase/dehydratase family protein [Caulobacter sp. 17J80-11]MBC6981051.1 NAD-dependent epimerase/dehydratase family protein [Caulobacter sp. 17J80-11]
MTFAGDGSFPVTVLGATSLVGRFALPRLAAAGRRVAAVSRRPGEAQPDVDWIGADLEGPELAALPAAREVLSLSPIWLLSTRVLETLRDRGMTRLVAFSSTSRFTKERSPDPAERAVAARLADGEARVEAFCATCGVAWTVLRPTLIYAEGLDRNVSRLAGLARRFGVLPLSGHARGLRQPVHADDLAAAAVEALGREAAFGRAYDLPGGETLSYRAMAERVFAGLGRTPRILSVPKSVWRAGLAVAAPLLPGVGAEMGERMDQDLAFDGADAERDLGWAPRAFRPRFDAP